MPDLSFNTTAGQTVDRELLLLCLNTGTKAAPVWSPIGKRAEESSAEYDWQRESKKDVLGNTFNTGKKPIITQTFEPCELDGGDVAQVKIWNLAIREQNVAALMAQDMMVIHTYAGFAERYMECSVLPTSLGGAGGGAVGMPIEVTFGGERILGSAAKGADGAITFTPDSDG